MTDLSDLLARVEAATGGDRELDARIVAHFNDALLKPYPPTDDFGPKNRWQFWSLDGKHFIGNEGTPRFKIEPYTASLDASLALVERVLPNAERIDVRTFPTMKSHSAEVWPNDEEFKRASGRTPALALCAALLKALIAANADTTEPITRSGMNNESNPTPLPGGRG